MCVYMLCTYVCTYILFVKFVLFSLYVSQIYMYILTYILYFNLQLKCVYHENLYKQLIRILQIF